MKILDAVLAAGGRVLRPIVLDKINGLLPAKSRLNPLTTGEAAIKAIEKLPEETQHEILNAQIIETQESYSTLRAALEHDAATPHTTRPRIAMGAFYVVAFAVVGVISAWLVAVINEDTATVQAITQGWPFILALLGPFTVLLRAYFGVLGKEKATVLNASMGKSTTPGFTAIIDGILTRK